MGHEEFKPHQVKREDIWSYLEQESLRIEALTQQISNQIAKKSEVFTVVSKELERLKNNSRYLAEAVEKQGLFRQSVAAQIEALRGAQASMYAQIKELPEFQMTGFAFDPSLLQFEASQVLGAISQQIVADKKFLIRQAGSQHPRNWPRDIGSLRGIHRLARRECIALYSVPDQGRVLNLLQLRSKSERNQYLKDNSNDIGEAALAHVQRKRYPSHIKAALEQSAEALSKGLYSASQALSLSIVEDIWRNTLGRMRSRNLFETFVAMDVKSTSKATYRWSYVFTASQLVYLPGNWNDPEFIAPDHLNRHRSHHFVESKQFRAENGVKALLLALSWAEVSRIEPIPGQAVMARIRNNQ